MNKQELIEYCLSFSNSYEDFQYGSEYAAIRYSSNQIIFALVYECDNRLCVELRCDDTDIIRQAFDSVEPGRRMKTFCVVVE